MSDSIYRADSMAFLALQAKPPVFDPSKRPQLDLAHVTSVPPFVKDFDKALETHCMFRIAALSNPDTHEIRTGDDLDRPGSMGLLFGMQHAPDELTKERVQQFFDAGVRVMAIAYDGQNEYGSGFKSNGGLTDRGVELITWMNDVGMILDLSHSNDKTTRMTLELITQPSFTICPMASHSACDEIFQHARNLPDDIIFKIASLNGYIGIPAITFMIAKEGSDYLNEFLEHVDYAMEMTDQHNCVGIGSDCNHIDMTIGEARTHFERMKQMLKTAGSLGEYFPDRPPEIIEDGSSMFEIFEQTLLAKYLPPDVEDICGKNFKAFLERSLPRA